VETCKTDSTAPNGMIRQDPRNSIHGWFFSEAELRSVLANGHMINPSIDLSNPCNLNCPYCYIEEKASTRKVRRPNELSHDEVVQVITALRACGAKTINLVGAGEPTIDPHFEETIELIDGLGMTSVLFTNGIRFATEPALVRFVQRKNVSVVLKYNSGDVQTQDIVAGRKGYTVKRDAALDLFLDAGFNAHEPTRLGIDTIVFRGNVAELPAIHRMCRENNIFPIAGEYIPTGRTERGRFQGFGALAGLSESERQHVAELLQPINDGERVALFSALRVVDKSFGIVAHDHCAYFGGGICTQILGLYIDIEGNIWPCVARSQFDEHGVTSGWLGNVRQGHSITDLWASHPFLRSLRQQYNGACPYKQPLGGR